MYLSKTNLVLICLLTVTVFFLGTVLMSNQVARADTPNELYGVPEHAPQLDFQGDDAIDMAPDDAYYNPLLQIKYFSDCDTRVWVIFLENDGINPGGAAVIERPMNLDAMTKYCNAQY